MIVDCDMYIFPADAAGIGLAMPVAGVPKPRDDHVLAIADFAHDARSSLADLTASKGRRAPVRIGIATGPVVAGVVGKSKFFYDVWGGTVNVAARMEQICEPGHIQLSPEMVEHLRDRYVLAARMSIDIRGKGKMRTGTLVGKCA